MVEDRMVGGEEDHQALRKAFETLKAISMT